MNTSKEELAAMGRQDTFPLSATGEHMGLTDLGWTPDLARHFEPFARQGLAPARVAREERQAYLVCTEQGELTAELAGKMRHEAASRGDLPAVGDWVAVAPRPTEGKATVLAVLPRTSAFSRKVAGGHTQEQVVAANVDTVFLVCGLDHEFNLRRLERYLTLVWESGAAPVVVLNKAYVCPDVEAHVGEAESVALGVPIHAISATERLGFDALEAHLGVGRTAAFLGSSGVGKSTIINRLLGTELLKTSAVRDDDSRGRHTTTHRELIVIPGKGMVIDTPGMRELQLWADGDGLRQAFDVIEALAAQCRFGDCAHHSEPGCAVQQALADGALAAERWQSYLKLQRELRHLERRKDQKARLAEEAKWKDIARLQRARKKQRRKEGLW